MAKSLLRWVNRAGLLLFTVFAAGLAGCMQEPADTGDSAQSHAEVAGNGYLADRNGIVIRIVDESFYTEPKRLLIMTSEGELEGYFRVQDNKFSECDHLGCSPTEDLRHIDRHALSKGFGLAPAGPGRLMVQSIIAEAVRDLPNREGTPKQATETIRKGTPYYELKLVSDPGGVVSSTMRSRIAVEEIPPWLDGEQQAAPPGPSATAAADPCAALQARFQRIELPMAERVAIMREMVDCRRKYPQEEAAPESLAGPEPARPRMPEQAAPPILADEPADRAPVGTGPGPHLRIEFIGREPPSSFVFGPGADDTNQVNPTSAGIRFTGVDLPCDAYHLYVDEADVSGGGVDRSIDLCAARGFVVRPGEIYTLRNRSGHDLVSRNVRVDDRHSGGARETGESPVEHDASYVAALHEAITRNWARPDSVLHGQRCRLYITQLPGGQVIDVEFDPSCPYDGAGRRSVEAAVRRAEPLPYAGFESVFNRRLNLDFTAENR